MLPSRWLAASIALALAACGPASGPPEPTLETDDQRAVYALGLLIAQGTTRWFTRSGARA